MYTGEPEELYSREFANIICKQATERDESLEPI